MTVANCFAQLDSWQLRLVNTSLLCQILQAHNPMATCDIQSLLNDANCFACLGEKELTTIQTQLLCEILNGGSTSACITCVDAAPVDDPGCDCAIAYGRVGTAVAGYWWQWDSAGAKWDLVLS